MLGIEKVNMFNIYFQFEISKYYSIHIIYFVKAAYDK